MKIELKSSILPVLGWSDVAECKCYEQLAKDMNDGEEIIYNTIREFEDDELCAYIFYNDFDSGTLYTVFIGRVEFIGRHPDHSAPFVYVFYPMKQIKVKGVGYCKCCGEPEAVMLKSKKL
ncbi:MAG: hypothetical protein DAHOPDDO_00851 [Ignavibacteriaceae bacterium]|nr:hypothetical protein [Ignavibacteriaceae bacterium]